MEFYISILYLRSLHPRVYFLRISCLQDQERIMNLLQQRKTQKAIFYMKVGTNNAFSRYV